MTKPNFTKVTSSLFKEYAYDSTQNELTIKFNDGREYTYF